MEYQIVKIKSDRFMIMRQYQSLAEFWRRKDGTLTVNYTDGYQDLQIDEKIICQLHIQRKFETCDYSE